MPRGFLVKRRCRRPAAPFRPRPPGPAARSLEEAPRAPEEPPAEPPPEPPAQGPPPVQGPPPARRARARRAGWADELGASPVLGLRIRAAAEAGAAGPGPGPGPGGAFVCQLCRQPFPDPPALAQHRCSRIARVEYRCPDCAKSFGCPANLASHRRWHRPRPAAPDGAPAPGPAPGPGPGPAPLLCPHCRRGFRRQAYLRRHLGTHRPPPPPPPPPLWAPDGPAAACKRCPAALLKCPPADARPLLLLQLPLRPAC